MRYSEVPTFWSLVYGKAVRFAKAVAKSLETLDQELLIRLPGLGQVCQLSQGVAWDRETFCCRLLQPWASNSPKWGSY